jgi:hypothetical protein
MLESGLTPGTMLTPDGVVSVGPCKIKDEVGAGYWVSYGVSFEHEGILSKNYWNTWSVMKTPKPRRCLNPIET